jgi:signal transduction histidine kinase
MKKALLLWINLFIVSFIVAQQTLLQKIDSMIQLVNTTDNEAIKLSLYNKICFAYNQYDPSKGLEFGLKAEELANKLGNKEGLTQAYNGLGANYIMLSNRDLGVQYFEKAGQINLEIGNKKGYAQNMGNIGQVKYYGGDLDGALDYLIKSLRIMEGLNDTMGIAIQAGGIANIYNLQKNNTKALYYDSLALLKYTEAKDQDGIALTLGNLANIYSDVSDKKLALEVYQKAIEIYRKLGSKPGVARNLINMATIYNGFNNFQKAASLLTEAREKFFSMSDKRGYAMATGNLGTSYRKSYKNFDTKDTTFKIIPGTKINLLDKAEEYYVTAINILNEIQELTGLDAFSRELSMVYEEKHDFGNALKYYKMYSQTKDSLYSNESKITIERLTTEREVELKNKQIEIDRLEVLKKRNERIYFIIGMGLLILALIFIYRNYTNQRKANAELEVLNNQILETNDELENKNVTLSSTLKNLKETQDQLVETERLKENAIIRGRISQDIHDDISSGLTKISWLAEMLKAKSSGSDAHVDLGVLEKINASSRETVSKLGEIIWSTNPDRDNLESLLAYLRNYISKYLEDTSFRYTIDFPEQLPAVIINPELRRNLFLVVKEALHNAVKYSQANHIAISFAVSNNYYHLQVNDDGIGIKEGLVQGGGNGMNNMRKRMDAIHGKMHIDSGEENGTRISFEGQLF